ncbi:GGDEF domain-containing response regulator [Argonema antarcticum]|uniref:two-component system response regulator n=1 Tax=Argonema antarcticum TaxID=2942763 RepID=UPI0020133C4F|nr:GGDEF domain-containing response regulator [Argonema antarcticum]MCL1471915.1 EAL domain-containing protein [Argonema antarcticum A004/B2]
MNNESVDLSKKDILIVDDTPANLRFLAKILTVQGYNVRKALNGQIALTSCQMILPDLILLDIMMPDMDGYEVCLRLKADEQTCKIPVIFISALSDVFDKVKGFKVGGIDYITKPFQFEEVIARVKSQLALREAEIKIYQLNLELEERVKERTFQLEVANQELLVEIMERKQLQNQLLHIALHDSLTDLPNRALFMQCLSESLNRAKEQPDYQFAVLFMDCDRFKIVNDSLGHLVGDELLIAIAHRLQGCLKPIDTIARLGGDEFAIILENITDLGMATQVAEQILQELSTPFQLSRYEVFINVSIGITLSNTYDDKPEYLLRNADTAMYRAKALGKARYHVFDPAMHQQALQLLQLENDLRRAVERKEFIVYYQPIISLYTGRISGFEALVRWKHPTRGLVSPGEFIPVAEETGLIASIDTWVLQEACHQLSIWQKQQPAEEPLTMGVNLSVRLLSQPNLIEYIAQVLQKTDLNPQTLKLEITESAIMENKESALIILDELKKRKIQLSIDDFGTGYSSLSYLDSFPVNTLKIDQSFINRMDGKLEKKGLVPAIISMAHRMGISAIAEGVETHEQLAQLRTLNCDFGQGYLFSKPLESKLAFALLASEPQW